VAFREIVWRQCCKTAVHPAASTKRNRTFIMRQFPGVFTLGRSGTASKSEENGKTTNDGGGLQFWGHP
jgi:hypothetical protein